MTQAYPDAAPTEQELTGLNQRSCDAAYPVPCPNGAAWRECPCGYGRRSVDGHAWGCSEEQEHELTVTVQPEAGYFAASLRTRRGVIRAYCH